MNFWSVKNVQKYYNYESVLINCQEILCHAALEVLWEHFLNPFPNDKILDSSKLEEFADDNFEFNENGRKSSERAENTVRKGETARYKRCLLFPQCFQNTFTADT